MQSSQNLEICFIDSIKHQFKYGELCPITFHPQTLYEAVYDVAKGSDKQDVTSIISGNIDQNSLLDQYLKQVQDTNNESLNILSSVCEQYMEIIHLPQRVSHIERKKRIQENVIQRISANKFCQTDRLSYYQEKLINSAEIIMEWLNEIFEIAAVHVHQLESTVESHENHEKIHLELKTNLQEIHNSQLQRISFDLFEWACIDSEAAINLFIVLKEASFSILKAVYDYIYEVSELGGRLMELLNTIMEKNNFLANIDTYKMMQVEISKQIFRQCCILLNQQWFFQIEFDDLRDQLIINILKRFFHISESKERNLQNSNFNSLQETLKSLNPNLKFSIQHTIQIISSEHQQLQSVESDENNLLYENIVEDRMTLLLSQQEVNVRRSQDVNNRRTGQIGTVVEFDGNYERFLVYMVRDCFILKELGQIDRAEWETMSEIETYSELSFADFIYFQGSILGELSNEDLIKQNSIQLEQTQSKIKILGRLRRRKIEQDELKGIVGVEQQSLINSPHIHHKHIQVPKKPIKFRTSATGLAGKTMGYGIGVMIVNCLDEDMEWEDKLKDAGNTTLTVGIIAVLSQRLPIVGLLIQGTLLVYAVQYTLRNKVVNLREKEKGLAHLGVQICIGVVCIVGGHMYIPLHFWGAFIGGLGAGIGIGVYSKFVVPKTILSLHELLDSLSCKIQDNGSVRYSPITLGMMHISEEFFMSSIPQKMTRSHWISLVLTCLVNEVHYMYQLLLGKQLEKQHLKLVKNPNDNTISQHIQEIQFNWIKNDVRQFEWKDTQMYLRKHNISVIENHEQINEFIKAMIENFKMDE